MSTAPPPSFSIEDELQKLRKPLNIGQELAALRQPALSPAAQQAGQLSFRASELAPAGEMFQQSPAAISTTPSTPKQAQATTIQEMQQALRFGYRVDDGGYVFDRAGRPVYERGPISPGELGRLALSAVLPAGGFAAGAASRASQAAAAQSARVAEATRMGRPALPAPGQTFREPLITPAPRIPEAVPLTATSAELIRPMLPSGSTRSVQPSPPTIYSRLRALPAEERVRIVGQNAAQVAQRFTPTKLPPIGGSAEVVKQNAVEAILTEATQPARNLRDVVRQVYRGGLQESNGVVRNFGPEGVEAVQRVQQADEVGRLAAARVAADLQKLGPIPDQAWNKIRLAREGTAIQLTAREQKVFEAVTTYLDGPTGPVTRGRAAGLDIGELPNYWPIRVNPDAVQRRASEAIQAIMERTGASQERAQAIFNRIIQQNRTGRPFGNLERSRENWVPEVLRKPARQEFTEYLQGAERRIAEAQYLGPKDNLVEPLLAKIRSANPSNGDFAETWFDAVTRRAPRDVLMQNLARSLGGVQAASKMVLSVVSNASQKANVLLATDVKTFAKTIRAVYGSSRPQTLDFARRTGAALESVLQGLAQQEGAASTSALKVLERTGFMGVEEGNRLFSAAAGREWAKDLALRLVREPKNAYVRRHLQKVGVDPETVLQQAGKLTPEQERFAGLRMSDYTQFKTDAGELPLFWSSPWGRIVTQFKRFAFKQGQFIKSAVIDEAKQGNLKPLVTLLAAYPIVGEAVADVRLLLRKGPSETYQALKDEGVSGIGRVPGRVMSQRPSGLLERAAENFAYVGALGIASDLVRALEASDPKSAAASFIGGPSFQEGVNIIGGVGKAGQDLLSVAEGRKTSLTGPRQLAKQGVQLTVTPALTARFGLPGAVAARSIENAGVFRSPNANQRRLAQQINDAAKRNDMSAVRRLQAEYLQRYGKVPQPR